MTTCKIFVNGDLIGVKDFSTEEIKELKNSNEIRLEYVKQKGVLNLTTYNYLESIKEDVKNYINEEITISDYETKEELEDYLNDTLWTCDSVTGNASESYTFNRATAQEYVEANKELIQEMAQEFDCKDQVMAWWYEDNYEAIDVSIRCYLLSQAISEALEDIEEFEEV